MLKLGQPYACFFASCFLIPLGGVRYGHRGLLGILCCFDAWIILCKPYTYCSGWRSGCCRNLAFHRAGLDAVRWLLMRHSPSRSCCAFIANLQISPDFPANQKKSGWLYIWVVVVVVVVVCTRRLGTRTNMSATESTDWYTFLTPW